MFNQHSISLGMFVAAGCYLAWWLGRWWSNGGKGSRNWKALAPLAWGLAITMMCAACTSGLLGWVTHLGGSVESQAGNFALTAGTGTHTVNATTARTFGVLTQWGAAVLLLVIAAVVGMWKHVKQHIRKDIWGGAWVGIGMGPLIGGYLMIPAINDLGLHTIGKLFGVA